jgi:hypothetical protein
LPDQPQSGRDLARQALAAYKATRSTHPAGKPTTRTRTARRDRGSGRDPVAFGAIVGALNAEQGWGAALRGGSITDRWATLCPTEYADKLRPAGFDPETGTLRLVTDSPTVAATLRLLGSKLIDYVNRQLTPGTGVGPIRKLKVAVGNLGASGRPGADVPDQPVRAEPPPVRTRESASPGYQRVLALALEHKPAHDPLLDDRIRAAAEAGDRWLADPANREPEDAFSDAVAAQERAAAAAGPQPGTLEAAVAAALAYKHGGSHHREVRRVFGAS